MTMSGDNITPFPGMGELPEPTVTVTESKQPYCRHPAIRLVKQDRLVICAECGASLDPFSYLCGQAHAIRTAWDNHRMVKAKVDQLVERIRALEKEAQRMGARVRRLKAKEGAPIDFRKPL